MPGAVPTAGVWPCMIASPQNGGETMRRYTIHADCRGTWVLVSSDGSYRWHVERLGVRCSRISMSLQTFEGRADRWLSARLEVALKRAEQDTQGVDA